MQKVEIKLDFGETAIAAMVGVLRVIFAVFDPKAGATYGIDVTNTGYQDGAIGAIGEYALCKHKGCFWRFGIGCYKKGDVDNFYEVRSTPNFKKGDYLIKRSMILHDEDLDDKPYIGAWPDLKGRKVVLRGWLWGHEGKDPKYWTEKNQNGRPAYFVPKEDLRPMSTLPASPRESALTGGPVTFESEQSSSGDQVPLF